MDIQEALDQMLADDPAMQEYITKFWYIEPGAGAPTECNYVVRLNSTADVGRILQVGIVATSKLIYILEPLLALIDLESPPIDPDLPARPPVGSLGSGDGFDFASAEQHRGPYFTEWPATTEITKLELRTTGVYVEFDKKNGTGRWPDVTPTGWDGPIQYTLGMAMNISGRWHVSAPIQFWNTLEQSGGNVGNPGPMANGINGTVAGDWFYAREWAPMNRQPMAGETVGFFVVAGSMRGAGSDAISVHERSNCVLVPFPTIVGANFVRS